MGRSRNSPVFPSFPLKAGGMQVQTTNSHASERLQNAIAALVGEQEYNDDDDEEISPVEIGVAATMITSCIAPNSDFSASLDMDIAAGYDSAMYQGDYENY